MSVCKALGWGKKSGKYYERTNIIAGLVDNKRAKAWSSCDYG